MVLWAEIVDKWPWFYIRLHSTECVGGAGRLLTWFNIFLSKMQLWNKNCLYFVLFWFLENTHFKSNRYIRLCGLKLSLNNGRSDMENCSFLSTFADQQNRALTLKFQHFWYVSLWIALHCLISVDFSNNLLSVCLFNLVEMDSLFWFL